MSVFTITDALAKVVPAASPDSVTANVAPFRRLIVITALLEVA